MVRIKHDTREETAILKARGGNPDALYHELKLLLRMAPHKNVVARPLFLVTLCYQSGIERACGFILKFYPGPNFEQALKQKNRDATLHLSDQLNWAKDVGRGLLHVQSSPVKFASDLKMDNIMMPIDDGQEIPILIDFEQSRNVFARAAKEIYLVEWLGTVANSSRVTPIVRNKYTSLL